MVEYATIFAEDEEGNQGDFIEGVRDQHLTDREDYIDALEEALWDQARTENMNKNQTSL